jgi:hypothetical protein
MMRPPKGKGYAIDAAAGAAPAPSDQRHLFPVSDGARYGAVCGRVRASSHDQSPSHLV